MSKTPISPLRARMIEGMSVRKFGEKTQNDYIRHVKTFSTFLGRSPATATAEDLRRYQVHQSRERVAPDHQRVGRCPAVLFQGDAQPSRDGPAPDACAPAGEAPGRAQRGGGGAASGGSTWYQAQGRVQRRLWCRPS